MSGTIGNILSGIRSIFTWWLTLSPWEAGLRVRLGKRVTVLGAGIYLRVPGFDRFYVQSVRMRTVDLGVQTVTTTDGKTITTAGMLQYRIADILKLYQTLHHADDTLADLALAQVAQFIATHSLEECAPLQIQSHVDQELDLEQYGLAADGVSITDFAVVKTFRLIQDNKRYSLGESLRMNDQLKPGTSS